jgi:hypothetical protein
MRLVEEKPTEWAAIQPMNYGFECHPDNVKMNEKLWGKK